MIPLQMLTPQSIPFHMMLPTTPAMMPQQQPHMIQQVQIPTEQPPLPLQSFAPQQPIPPVRQQHTQQENELFRPVQLFTDTLIQPPPPKRRRDNATEEARAEVSNKMPEFDSDEYDSVSSMSPTLSGSSSSESDSSDPSYSPYNASSYSPRASSSGSSKPAVSLLKRAADIHQWPAFHVPLYTDVKPSLNLQLACIGELTGAGASRWRDPAFKDAEKAWRFWHKNGLLNDGAPSDAFLRHARHSLNAPPDINAPPDRRVFMCLVMDVRECRGLLYSRSNGHVWARLKLDVSVMRELGVRKPGDWVVVQCSIKEFQFHFTKSDNGKYVVRCSGASEDRPRLYADTHDAVAAAWSSS